MDSEHPADDGALVQPLQQSGLAFDDALRAATLSSMAIIGVVETEHLFGELTPPDDTMLAWLPNTRVAFQRKGNHGRDFELVVRSIIDGLYTRVQGSDPATDASRARRTPRSARTSGPAAARTRRR
jgi:hypothetical protein